MNLNPPQGKVILWLISVFNFTDIWWIWDATEAQAIFNNISMNNISNQH